VADKKVFDITHPEQSPSVSEKPKKIMLAEPKAEDTQAASAPELAATPDAAPVSRRGMTIKPASSAGQLVEVKTTESEVSESATQIVSVATKPAEATATDTEVEVEPVVGEVLNTEETPTEAAPEASEESLTTIQEPFGVADIGLNDSQKATTAIKQTMQDPKIYDTKVYYVPIGKTHHKHGHVAGAVLAGLLAGAAAIGAILYAVQGL
jgi:hypothetical protein